MKLFRSKLEVIKDEIDYKQLNKESVDTKVLVTQAQAQVDEVQARLKTQAVMLDMTCKMQLKDDCMAVENAIVKISKSKGKNSEKLLKNLETAMLRLKISAENILK